MAHLTQKGKQHHLALVPGEGGERSRQHLPPDASGAAFLWSGAGGWGEEPHGGNTEGGPNELRAWRVGGLQAQQLFGAAAPHPGCHLSAALILEPPAPPDPQLVLAVVGEDRSPRQAMCGPEGRRVEEETRGDCLPEGSKEGEAATGPRVPGAEWHGARGGSRPASGPPTAPGPESRGRCRLRLSPPSTGPCPRQALRPTCQDRCPGPNGYQPHRPSTFSGKCGCHGHLPRKPQHCSQGGVQVGTCLGEGGMAGGRPEQGQASVTGCKAPPPCLPDPPSRDPAGLARGVLRGAEPGPGCTEHHPPPPEHLPQRHPPPPGGCPSPGWGAHGGLRPGPALEPARMGSVPSQQRPPGLGGSREDNGPPQPLLPPTEEPPWLLPRLPPAGAGSHRCAGQEQLPPASPAIGAPAPPPPFVPAA